MEEWINKGGKLVCSRCGISIELGMPFKGEKLTSYRDWYVKDEMHDIRNGYDRCRCMQDFSYASDMRRALLTEARQSYEAGRWKRKLQMAAFIILTLSIFLLVDFS